MKYIYQTLIISLIAFGTVSCDDWFDLRPDSETVLEDFWKNENDVLSVVSSCYRAMLEPSFMESMIVWGELRSDNVIGNSNLEENMEKILALNLTPSNEYSKWEHLYKIIGYCNTVMYYAPGVREKDPNFTQVRLNSYLAEVKGVRALCYLRLVQTFRDVPLILEPYTDDTEPFQIAQSSPEEVLSYLIQDLESIENGAVMDRNTEAQSKGRITRNAIRAIIADMYLWLNDYENTIKYCDRILNDKGTLDLEAPTSYNENIYITGNSKESIFELQFDETSVWNYVLFELYGTSRNYEGRGKVGQLLAFNFSSTNPLFGTTDLRGKDALLPGSAQSYIMKYLYLRNTAATLFPITEKHFSLGSPYPNWIFYRLADVYLMKAEALVERGTAKDLEDAHTMASMTYDRANPDISAGSLPSSSSQSEMRDIVFDERQREFIFEGKRYFDLLRRINREKSASNVVSKYLIRKYSKLDAATVRTKLSDIDALYVPIHKDELGANHLLKQNPFYITYESGGSSN